MKKADRNSWKTLPSIKEKVLLPLSMEFSDEEFEILTDGLIPQEMEDKWFVYFENDNLYFHRSWTGLFVYQAKIGKNGVNYFIEKAWTDGEYVYEQEKEESLRDSANLLEYLINGLILNKDVEFPRL